MRTSVATKTFPRRAPMMSTPRPLAIGRQPDSGMPKNRSVLSRAHRAHLIYWCSVSQASWGYRLGSGWVPAQRCR
jgi:hypothetical protein